MNSAYFCRKNPAQTQHPTGLHHPMTRPPYYCTHVKSCALKDPMNSVLFRSKTHAQIRYFKEVYHPGTIHMIQNVCKRAL